VNNSAEVDEQSSSRYAENDLVMLPDLRSESIAGEQET
jgi:hypothetical protein